MPGGPQGGLACVLPVRSLSPFLLPLLSSSSPPLPLFSSSLLLFSSSPLSSLLSLRSGHPPCGPPGMLPSSADSKTAFFVATAATLGDQLTCHFIWRVWE